MPTLVLDGVTSGVYDIFIRRMRDVGKGSQPHKVGILPQYDLGWAESIVLQLGSQRVGLVINRSNFYIVGVIRIDENVLGETKFFKKISPHTSHEVNAEVSYQDLGFDDLRFQTYVGSEENLYSTFWALLHLSREPSPLVLNRLSSIYKTGVASAVIFISEASRFEIICDYFKVGLGGEPRCLTAVEISDFIKSWGSLSEEYHQGSEEEKMTYSGKLRLVLSAEKIAEEEKANEIVNIEAMKRKGASERQKMKKDNGQQHRTKVSKGVHSKKELEKDTVRRKIRAHAQVIRAALLFRDAGERTKASVSGVPKLATSDGECTLSQEELTAVSRDHDLSALERHGGALGIAELLKSNLEKGTVGNEADWASRRSTFSSNTYPKKECRSFWRFLWEAWQDTTLIILMVAAAASLALGMKTEGVEEGWYDGRSIIFVTAFTDYRQSLPFQILNEEKENMHIEVIRGGKGLQVSIFDLVVGDVVPLKIGDQDGGLAPMIEEEELDLGAGIAVDNAMMEDVEVVGEGLELVPIENEERALVLYEPVEKRGFQYTVDKDLIASFKVPADSRNRPAEEKPATSDNLQEQGLPMTREKIDPSKFFQNATPIGPPRDVTVHVAKLVPSGDQSAVFTPGAYSHPKFHYNAYENNTGDYPGGYNGKQSLLFHGYGYNQQMPYGPYSPATTPTIGGDGQIYSPQQYPFSVAPAYYHQTKYITSPTPVSQMEPSRPVCSNHQGDTLLFGPRPSFAPNLESSFKGSSSGGNSSSSSYYDSRQSYDGFGSVAFWMDWSKSLEGQRPFTPISPTVSPQPVNTLGSFGHDMKMEYIVVMVCNGKRKNQTKEDLEDFLGEMTEDFVSWLYDYLSENFDQSRASIKSSVSEGIISPKYPSSGVQISSEVSAGNKSCMQYLYKKQPFVENAYGSYTKLIEKEQQKDLLIVSSGSLNLIVEDIDSRTVHVSNVHFGNIVSHFSKCGAVVKVIELNDVTGQPKGEAYVTFADKESADKALELSGTSLFSRLLKVVMKTEMPVVTSSPIKRSWNHSYYPFIKQPTFQRRTHMEWKRDQGTSEDSVSYPLSKEKPETSETTVKQGSKLNQSASLSSWMVSSETSDQQESRPSNQSASFST